MGAIRPTGAFCCSSDLLMVSAVTANGQPPDVAFVGSGVSISFQNSGNYAVGAGVSISFANASSIADRGVSVAFGEATPPPTTTSLGGVSTTNPVGFSNEPVNTATGDYFNSPTDLTLPGKGIPFIFTRSYNSQDPYSGPMGAGWTHSYNIYLTVDGSGNVGIKQADGHQDYYAPAGGGAFTPQTRGLFSTLVQNADSSFTLTFKNQTRFNFSSAGRLQAMVDRNGNTQTLAYDGSARLISVIDPSGRVFGFSYDGSGHLTSLSDAAGRTVHYGY